MFHDYWLLVGVLVTCDWLLVTSNWLSLGFGLGLALVLWLWSLLGLGLGCGLGLLLGLGLGLDLGLCFMITGYCSGTGYWLGVLFTVYWLLVNG